MCGFQQAITDAGGITLVTKIVVMFHLQCRALWWNGMSHNYAFDTSDLDTSLYRTWINTLQSLQSQVGENPVNFY